MRRAEANAPANYSSEREKRIKARPGIRAAWGTRLLGVYRVYGRLFSSITKNAVPSGQLTEGRPAHHLATVKP